MDELYNFKAVITFQIYYNQDSMFGVYSFITADDIPTFKEELVMSGTMPRLKLDMTYYVTARITTNKKFGKQYEVINISLAKPDDADSSMAFLKAFCTQRQARLILEKYPTFVNDVLDGQNIFDVKGIKSDKIRKIVNDIRDNYSMNDVISLLAPLGVSMNMIMKLVHGYNEMKKKEGSIKDVLYESPYILTQIHGLGFKKIDGVALRINPNLKTSQARAEAFIEYVLKNVANGEGSTLIQKSRILSEASKYDSINIESFSNFVEKGSLVGLERYYIMESSIYHKVKELSERCIVNAQANVNKIEDVINISYTEEQRKAFEYVNDTDFLIITGNAGTGKTTIIAGLVEMFSDKSIAMCALSAKAAARMKEVTGKPAYTIHKLLGWDGHTFMYNKDNHLPHDIVILDEASMVNVYMFWNLINAIQGKFIIVFDNAQLPPIGAGNIASDLLQMDVKKVVLTKIHRQAARSGIILHANQIRKGINPVVASGTYGELMDMHYVFEEKNYLQNMILTKFFSAIEKYGSENVSIIVPRKKNVPLSTTELNHIIHEELFDNSIVRVIYGKKSFALGARVIQRVNDYDKMVFNGEVGRISDVTPMGYKVQFLDREIEFEREELKNMELAYALTVHSYQGSQSRIIIIGLDMSHYVLLDNCLLYTAITRASEHCLVVAERKAFNVAVKKNKGTERSTFLKRIIENKIKAYESVSSDGPEPV